MLATVQQTFDRSATLYDAVYAARGKSYRAEAATLRSLLEARGVPPGASLLDVACGTGEHLRYFAPTYDVTGLDASEAMLSVARDKLPGVIFHRQDMTTFRLQRSFDVITCLFASIGYLPDEEAVTSALRRMAAHLRPGGMLLLEPALTPDRVAPARTSTTHFDTTIDGRPASVTRTDSAWREPSVLHIRFDYEVRRRNGGARSPALLELTEHHPILLLSRERYLLAFERAGLCVEHLDPGLGPAGLFLATTPP